MRDEHPTGTRPYSYMLSACTEPECDTLTMGGTCVTHDAPTTITWPRGRPHIMASPVVVDSP